MACKGICHKYAEKGVIVRDWNTNPDMMRCSSCEKVFHRRYWIITESRTIRCICCKTVLSGRSSGVKARQKRWEEFIERNKEMENPSVIKLTEHKAQYLKHLVTSYMEIKFFDYNMMEIAGFSIKQWQNRTYPVPEGYMVKNKRSGFIFAKIPKEILIRNKIISKLSIKN